MSHRIRIIFAAVALTSAALTISVAPADAGGDSCPTVCGPSDAPLPPCGSTTIPTTCDEPPPSCGPTVPECPTLATGTNPHRTMVKRRIHRG